MMFWWLFFLAAVIVGILWLVRGGPAESWRAPRRETPLETLDRRFAEGAISLEEYHERRRVLTGGHDETFSEQGNATESGGTRP